MTKEILKNLTDSGLSQRKIAEKLEICQATVKYWLRKFKLQTLNKPTRFRSKRVYHCKHCDKTWTDNTVKKFCSSQCSSNFQHSEFIKRWKNGEESGLSGEDNISEHIRKYLFKKHNNKCQECGWSKINKYTGKIPLTVNHIDGNFANNKEENLELICPSCHSLTYNYGNANKGNGRTYRQKWRARNKIKDAVVT